MKTPIAIFGAGGLGRETATSLDQLTYEHPEGWELVGFYDDTMPIGTEIGNFGIVLGGIKELNELDHPINLAICIGYPQGRYNVRQAITNPLINYPNLIHNDLRISNRSSLNIGCGNLIQSGCSITTNTTIGNFNMLNGEVYLGHDDRIGDFNVFMNGTRVSGWVNITDRNLFGTMSYIMEKIKMGSDIVVGPLSALLTKPKDGCTYIGNPAKRLKY